MSFIATARPPELEADLQLDNDPWWPAIELGALRAACRLDGTVTAARLLHAALAATAGVNAELAPWRAARELEGHTSLAAVPAPIMNGASIKLHHYQRAIYAAVQADLAEVYREIDTTPQGAGKAERVTDQLAVKVDDHRRNMRWAISDLIGIRRTTVELI